MRQKVTLTNNQLQELNDFYEYCIEHKANFESYASVCTQARLFIEACLEEKVAIGSSVALLAFSAIVQHRKDNLFEVIKRDFGNSKSVRIKLPLLDELNKERWYYG